MYAKVIAVQLSLVTVPYAQRPVATTQAKNFLDINLSTCLSAKAFKAVMIPPKGKYLLKFVDNSFKCISFQKGLRKKLRRRDFQLLFH